jgi:dTMP kinase
VACRRGLLVSIEGISGVGKTHLTNLLGAEITRTDATGTVMVKGFSQRPASVPGDLGRDLLHALIEASDGEHFLRGGYPASETLLLLAIKMYDYEASLLALREGRLVLEGRSLHTIAVYQSLIMHSDDHQALAEARAILELGQQWRPLPDLAILIVDDVETAGRRAERRDGTRYTQEQWRIHRRAAMLFERLAADDPTRMQILDRRALDTQEAVCLMQTWISARQPAPPCLLELCRAYPGPAACQAHCRLTQPTSPLPPTAASPTASR